MKVTFLEAAVPLTKTFYLKDGKIEKIGHPRIMDYTSHQLDVSDLEALRDTLVKHAAAGHCFLKGNVSRPLVKEPRAGTTSPNEDTELLLLDLDGVKGIDSVEEFLAQTKLSGSDYIVQYSSSMGVLPGRGMSAHIFVWLDKAYAPAILKQYLIQWNLGIPVLQGNLGLTRTYNALHWALDVTTCQNDKLIYIAPPLLRDGVVDSFEGERIQLVRGKRRRLPLPAPFPNAEANAEKAQAKLNELRKAMGLKERAKPVMRNRSGVEYMAKPDRAVVTGIREKDTFTYLNLNGGDSWGYYHHTHNPEFIYNFKSEPVYKTSELLPEYWAEVKDKMNEARPDANGKLYLAFRDFRSAGYYNGVYDEKTRRLIFAPAKGAEQLRDFLVQHGQPVGEYIPDWNVTFDPQAPMAVDVEARVVNTFQPSIYMTMKPRRVKEVPPTIRRVIFHMVGEDEEIFERLMNNLACIMQYRTMTGTAWVFHGVQGTGKGVFLRHVLRPLLGDTNVVTKRIREIDSQFNGFLSEGLALWVDEAEQNDFNAKGAMNADIKNYITDTPISVRKMHQMPYMAPNHMTWFLASNKGHIIQIDPGDRRFNVAMFQEKPIVLVPEDFRRIEDELSDFASYLLTREADAHLAKFALNNPAKQRMVLLNQPSIDVAADAILSGNLEFFWEQMPQGDIETTVPPLEREPARRYVTLIKSIVKEAPKCILREELHTLLAYTIGHLPATPVKFSSFLKHHKLHIGPVTRGGKPYRGIPVRWIIRDEWREPNAP